MTAVQKNRYYYNSVIWALCHMENTNPQYLATDSVKRDKRENVLFVLIPEEIYSHFFGSSASLWDCCYHTPPHHTALQELQEIQPPPPVSFSWWLLHLELSWPDNSIQLAEFEDVRSIAFFIFFARGRKIPDRWFKTCKVAKTEELVVWIPFHFHRWEDCRCADMCWWLSCCASRSLSAQSQSFPVSP